MNDPLQSRAYPLAVAACLIVALMCQCPSPAFAAASQVDHCQGHADGHERDTSEPDRSGNCCVDYVADVRPFSTYGASMPDGPAALPPSMTGTPAIGIAGTDLGLEPGPPPALSPPVFLLTGSLLI